MVGSGPSGMMLAGELALAGVDVVVIERRPTGELAGSRAGGIHSLRSRGPRPAPRRSAIDSWAEGQANLARSGRGVLDISDFPTRHPYGLALCRTAWSRSSRTGSNSSACRCIAVAVRFVQDETGVDVELADGEAVRATYLVGADGGRSVVRKAAVIGFQAGTATRSNLIAEVEVAEEAPSGMRQDETGVHGQRARGRANVPCRHDGAATRTGRRADLGRPQRCPRGGYGSDTGVHRLT